MADDNPFVLRPLSEDLVHIKILSEKFNEVRSNLVTRLREERARRAELELLVEHISEAEKFATRSMKKALVTAKDFLTLSNLAEKLKKENTRLKDENKELKNLASIEADMAAARQVAWERGAAKAQRALELERQAARGQAREARELADKEKSALLEAARASAEETQRRHEEEVAALRDEIKAIKEECAEEVNLAALQFEDRSAQHAERAATLDAEVRALQEQLSAATNHIAFMESRSATLQAERSRLLEVNRSLMLQQQRQAAQTPRAPLKARTEARAAPAAPPGFQLASTVCAPAAASSASTSRSAAPYPQLPVAWRSKAGAAAAAPALQPELHDADPLPGASELPSAPCPPSSPPGSRQRRGRRKLFEDPDFVFRPLPQWKPSAVPSTGALSALPAASASLAPQRPSPQMQEAKEALAPEVRPPSQAGRPAAPVRFTFKHRTVVGTFFSSRNDVDLQKAPLLPPGALTAPAMAAEGTAEETQPAPTAVTAGRADGAADWGPRAPPAEQEPKLDAPPAAAAELPQQAKAAKAERALHCQGPDGGPRPSQQAAKVASKLHSVGRGKPPARPARPTAAPAAKASAVKPKTIPDSFLQYLSKLPAPKAGWSVPPAAPADPAPAQPPTPAGAGAPSAPRHDRDDTRQFFRRQLHLQLQKDSEQLHQLKSPETEGEVSQTAGQSTCSPEPSREGAAAKLQADAPPAPADAQQQHAVKAPVVAPVQRSTIALPVPPEDERLQNAAAVAAVAPVQLPATAPPAQPQAAAAVAEVAPVQLPADVTCPAAASPRPLHPDGDAVVDEDDSQKHAAPEGASTPSSTEPELLKPATEPVGVEVADEEPERGNDHIPPTQRIQPVQPVQIEESFPSLSLADVSLDTDLSLSSLFPTQSLAEPRAEPPSQARPAAATERAGGAVEDSPQSLPTGEDPPRPVELDSTPKSGGAAAAAGQAGQVGPPDEAGEVDQDAETPKLPALSGATQGDAALRTPPSGSSTVPDSSLTVHCLQPKAAQEEASILEPRDAGPAVAEEHQAGGQEEASTDSAPPQTCVPSQEVAIGADPATERPSADQPRRQSPSSRSPSPRASMVCSPGATATEARDDAGLGDDADVARRRDPERRGSLMLQPLLSSPTSPVPAAIGRPLPPHRDDLKCAVGAWSPVRVEPGQSWEVPAQLDAVLRLDGTVHGQPADEAADEEVCAAPAAPRDDCSPPPSSGASTRPASSAASTASRAESISYSPLSEADEQRQQCDPDEAVAGGPDRAAFLEVLEDVEDAADQAGRAADGEGCAGGAEARRPRPPTPARAKSRPPVAATGLALLQEAYEIDCSQLGSFGRHKASFGSSASGKVLCAPSTMDSCGDAKKRRPSPDPSAPSSEGAGPEAHDGPDHLDHSLDLSTEAVTTSTTPQRRQQVRPVRKRRRLLDALNTFDL